MGKKTGPIPIMGGRSRCLYFLIVIHPKARLIRIYMSISTKKQIAPSRKDREQAFIYQFLSQQRRPPVSL